MLANNCFKIQKYLYCLGHLETLFAIVFEVFCLFFFIFKTCRYISTAHQKNLRLDLANSCLCRQPHWFKIIWVMKKLWIMDNEFQDMSWNRGDVNAGNN